MSTVLPGAEPFSRQGGPAGVLVLHGFTGNPQSLRPLAEALAEAGFTVELPLLPGHGTAMEDMIPTRWADWSGAAEAAYTSLAGRCESVAVAALSMGGTLACLLAERHPEIRGLTLVNPMLEPPAESFRDVLRGVLESGTEVAPGVGSDIAMEGSVELAYPGSPIEAALSLFEGVDEVAAGLERIVCPILLFSSRQDHVVPSTNGDYLVSHARVPVERVWLERSYHVATLDYDRDTIESGTVAFMRRVLGAEPASTIAAGGEDR
ncbi:MAG TPA: alpha/beta fold hydrolase [Acidimicrobiales bacterium]|nr:alpha/beta fold hydrolase [Acidimicrobiales bacterium]